MPPEQISNSGLDAGSSDDGLQPASPLHSPFPLDEGERHPTLVEPNPPGKSFSCISCAPSSLFPEVAAPHRQSLAAGISRSIVPHEHPLECDSSDEHALTMWV